MSASSLSAALLLAPDAALEEVVWIWLKPDAPLEVVPIWLKPDAALEVLPIWLKPEAALEVVLLLVVVASK